MTATAELELDAPGAAPKRILVAEDNQTTQELLKLLLTQRGHHVDIASDGEMALDSLRKRDYDVVLLDFHLPKMDGLEVAAAYRSDASGRAGPRFVAITADMKGLLGHAANCENFDQVVAKPFDLEDVCNIIEGEAVELAVTDLPDTPPNPAERAKVTPMRVVTRADHTPVADLGYRVLRWPDDFGAGGAASRGAAGFDAVVISEPMKARDVETLWSIPSLHALPVVDLTGSLGKRADIDASKLAGSETTRITEIVDTFQSRRAKLHRDLLHAEDLSDKLIARLYVSGGTLGVHYDATHEAFVGFNVAADYTALEKAAARLVQTGLLASEFFDRFHYCDRCGSSRMSVREECAHCHSTNLVEEAYLHHFRCAYQGAESDFRQGDELICPKCRRQLNHYSVDYDKPGFMMTCRQCGKAASEPEIGFVCTDCGAHAGGDAVRTRDVHSYKLTERGRAYAEAGKAMLEDKSRALRLAELPLELIVSLNAELKRYEEDGTPFTLLDITYSNASEIKHEEGQRQFETLRRQFLENLRQVLPQGDRVVEGQSYDVALMHRADADEVRARSEEITGQAAQNLRLDLGVRIHAYGPEAFA